MVFRIFPLKKHYKKIGIGIFYSLIGSHWDKLFCLIKSVNCFIEKTTCNHQYLKEEQ